MSIDEQERRAIAFLTKRLRDSTSGATKFDEPGILAALGKVRHLDVGNVTMAAMRCAADRSIKTPAMIGDPSSTVYAERVGPERSRRHPKPEDACHTCGREIHSPDLVCDRPTQRPAPTEHYPEHAARARADLRAILPAPSEEPA